MRANLNQTAFTGGEWSPRALGRTDFDRYQTALKRCRNAYPLAQGGVRRREGSEYLTAAATATANRSILVPFIAGRANAYQVEFSDSSCRIFNADGSLAGVTLAAPYAASALDRLDWAQSDSTMWLFHPGYPIHRLQLLDGDAWALSAAPFTTLPFSESGYLVTTASATLSLATVGAGRTLTASSAVFLASDVGRGVIWRSGLAVITAYSSATEVTVEITRAFPSVSLAVGQWTIDISPQTDCTPSAVGPVGDTVTLTLGAAGWRAANVGSMVRINGGLLKISGYTSGTIVNAVVIRELSATVAAQALAWSLEPPAWNVFYGYPRTGTVHQQRLIVAGNTKFPRVVWGSRLGEPLDFTAGTNDDNAFSFTIDGDESSPIAYLSATNDLAVLTESGELSMRSGVEKPLTPTNVRVKPESNHGSAPVRPVTVGREIMFVQKSGRKLRSFGYRYDFDGYNAPDMTALAEHMARRLDLVWLAYQQEPTPIIWAVRADGVLLSCTFDRDQQPTVVAWAQHDLGGVVECVAVVPDDGTDWVWVIVQRTINGSAVRYIERLNVLFEPIHPSVTTDGPVYGFTVDCGVVTDNASGVTTASAAHLIGETVDIVADGVRQPQQVVGGGGTVTLERSAKRILVGLPFETEITLLQPEFGTAMGSSQAQAARTGQMSMKFLETIGATVTNDRGSRQEVPFQRFGTGVLDQAPAPFTGLVPITLLGWDKGDGEISVVQEQPYPLHLLAVVRRHTVNG